MEKSGGFAEKAYQIIKADITNGKLRPGELLVESRFSKQIHISRTPVRAALQRLVCEGLAQTDANKSVRVTNVTEEDIEQITQVRRELETLAVRLFRDRAPPEKIAGLRALCQRECALVSAPSIDYLALIDVDYQLHTALAEMTGNRFLWETMKRIKTSSNRFLILSGTMEKYGALGVKEHDEFVSFLEKGRFDYAELAIRNHVVKIGERILI